MAEEPTNTPAANQPDSAPAPANTPEPAPAGDNPTPKPAEGATPPANDEPLLSLGDDGKKDAKPEGDPKPDDGKDKPAGAPESYSDFTLPDGFTWDDARKGEATTLFKELNLPQESAQKLVDAYCKAMKDQAAAQEAELMAYRKKGRAEVMARPDFREQKALADKGMRLLVTTEAQRKLMDSWLRDSPEIFDMFVSAGRLVAEDNMTRNTPPPKLTESQINQQRFPNL